MIATGGRGDREIFVYKASKAGKFAKQHCLRGHTGWIIQLLFDTENHLLSGSEDATIRLWHVGSGKYIKKNGDKKHIHAKFFGGFHDLIGYLTLILKICKKE